MEGGECEFSSQLCIQTKPWHLLIMDMLHHYTTGMIIGLSSGVKINNAHTHMPITECLLLGSSSKVYAIPATDTAFIPAQSLPKYINSNTWNLS